jgi:two-component system chemotaxis response regulator CheB
MSLEPARLARIEAVVIGASAGGVEALNVLLPALTEKLRVVVLVVLHLPRDRPSLLVEIFGPRCAVPVHEACDKEPLLPGEVYFAPPDYHLLVDPGPHAALSTEAPLNFSRPSIDVLFETAADAYGDRLMGVILTGGNHDGAAGLAAVATAGGLTVVQKPDTALASTMPLSALDRVVPDAVLGLDEIAALLAGLTTLDTRRDR